MAIKYKEEVSGNSSSPLIGQSQLSGNPFSKLVKPTRQANILIFGEDGTGKTSFCVKHAPEPIRVINFDGRADDVVAEAIKDGRDIEMCKIMLTHKDLPPGQMMKEAGRVVDETMYSLEYALSNGARTILFDTATEYSEILKLAFDGTLKQTKEGAYGKDKDFVNRQWWRIFNRARAAKSAHIIVTARHKEIWKKREDGTQYATGKFTYRCSPAVSAAVDWSAEIRLKKDHGRVIPAIELEIKKAGTNWEEISEIYSESDWEYMGGPFVYACVKMYKDSDLEDWQ